MSYRIAGIDVHKKMLAVVVTDVEVEGEHEFARREFGTPLTICDAYRTVRRTGGRGSCDGVHGAILETGMGT
jgi:hypothetical protein